MDRSVLELFCVCLFCVCVCVCVCLCVRVICLRLAVQRLAAWVTAAGGGTRRRTCRGRCRHSRRSRWCAALQHTRDVSGRSNGSVCVRAVCDRCVRSTGRADAGVVDRGVCGDMVSCVHATALCACWSLACGYSRESCDGLYRAGALCIAG